MKSVTAYVLCNLEQFMNSRGLSNFEIISFAMVWMFALLQNPDIEILTSQGDGRRWGFGRWLGPEGGALMNESSVLIKKP